MVLNNNNNRSWNTAVCTTTMLLFSLVSLILLSNNVLNATTSSSSNIISSDTSTSPHISTSKPHIAVCISGQFGRLNLESTFKHLFLPNTDVHFTLFYSLQQGHIHNTGTKYQPSPYLNYTAEELAAHISKVYLHHDHNNHHHDDNNNNNNHYNGIGSSGGSSSGGSSSLSSQLKRTYRRRRMSEVSSTTTTTKNTTSYNTSQSTSSSSPSPSAHHIKLGAVLEIPLVGEQGWQSRLNINFNGKHHVIAQKWLRPLTPFILEMYGHQVECIREVIRYEHKHKQHSSFPSSSSTVEDHSNSAYRPLFDYVLSIREDLFLFKPIDMLALLERYMRPTLLKKTSSTSSEVLDITSMTTSSASLHDSTNLSDSTTANEKTSPSSPHVAFDYHKLRQYYEFFPILKDDEIYTTTLYDSYQKQYLSYYDELKKKTTEASSISPLPSSSSSKSLSSPTCQMLSKDCLKWAGINIRFELFDRLTGILVLQTRIAYFHHLYVNNQQIFNPEQYDLTHVQNFHTTLCEGSKDELPLTVARLKKDTYCFEDDELFESTDQCYPSDQKEFAFAHLCKQL